MLWEFPPQQIVSKEKQLEQITHGEVLLNTVHSSTAGVTLRSALMVGGDEEGGRVSSISPPTPPLKEACPHSLPGLLRHAVTDMEKVS